MPYTQLLNQLIDKSGLAVKEIAERCSAQGQEITASYISILRKEANERIPSAEVSRALEAVLGAQSGELVLEGYLDGAPKELLQVIEIMRGPVIEFTFRAIDAALPIGKTEREFIAEQMRKMPLAQFILAMNKQQAQIFERNILTSSERIGETQLNVSMQANVDFDITDNAMQPLLPEGSKAKLKFQTEFQSGEIVAVILNDDKSMIFRKLYDTKDGKRMLMPLNPAYDVVEFEPGLMIIFGRVEAVVTAL